MVLVHLDKVLCKDFEGTSWILDQLGVGLSSKSTVNILSSLALVASAMNHASHRGWWIFLGSERRQRAKTQEGDTGSQCQKGKEHQKHSCDRRTLVPRIQGSMSAWVLQITQHHSVHLYTNHLSVHEHLHSHLNISLHFNYINPFHKGLSAFSTKRLLHLNYL